MAELKKGFKAGAVVGLIWALVTIIYDLILNVDMSLTRYTNIAYYLFLVSWLAASALIWGIIGLFFAALYNNLPKNKAYKLGLFSSILAALFIIIHVSSQVLVHLNLTIFFIIITYVIMLVFIPVLHLQSILYYPGLGYILFFSKIIIYGLISTLLLNYFWNKFGRKEAKKKE